MRGPGFHPDLQRRPHRRQHEHLSRAGAHAHVATDREESPRAPPVERRSERRFLADGPHDPRHPDELTDRGGPGRARDTQRRNGTEPENQHRIQHDVDKTHRPGDPDRRAHVLHAAQHAEPRGHQQARGHAQQANVEIGARVGAHPGFGAHPADQPLDVEPCQQRNGQAQPDRQHERDTADLAEFRGQRAVRCGGSPQGAGGLGLRADAQEIEDPQQTGQQRGRRPETGRGDDAQPFDEDRIDQAGERLDHQRHEYRQAQAEEGRVRAIEKGVSQPR